MSPEERRQLLDVIGLKTCQRVGHRHKVSELRSLRDLASGFEAVDAWVTATDAPGGRRAMGDLFDPLLADLVRRARSLLGAAADEPTAEQLKEMAEALAAERSVTQTRLLLAAVVELGFTAAPEALALSGTDPRFALPTPSRDPA